MLSPCLFPGNRPLIFYAILISVQVCLVIVLFVFAARGKRFMDESDRGSGLPYYAGAFLLGCVVSPSIHWQTLYIFIH